jgi:hypothetical protein
MANEIALVLEEKFPRIMEEFTKGGSNEEK